MTAFQINQHVDATLGGKDAKTSKDTQLLDSLASISKKIEKQFPGDAIAKALINACKRFTVYLKEGTQVGEASLMEQNKEAKAKPSPAIDAPINSDGEPEEQSTPATVKGEHPHSPVQDSVDKPKAESKPQLEVKMKSADTDVNPAVTANLQKAEAPKKEDTKRELPSAVSPPKSSTQAEKVPSVSGPNDLF